MGTISNFFGGLKTGIVNIFVGIYTEIREFFVLWFKRLFDKNERFNYFSREWQKVLVVTLYVLINIGLATEAALRNLY